MDTANLFATRFRELRQRHASSQAAFATLIQVSQQTVSNWENGRHTPDAVELAALCRLFRVSADYLCGLSDHPSGLPPGHWLVDLDAFESPEKATPEDEVFVPIPARAVIVDPRRFLEMRDDLSRRLTITKRRKHRGTR